ncbi:Mss4-like protein [Annulohypoxylon maeteangense]|uniref:Mss4-like protein n=1 Tax=Annulohypoxylon maeteangense TaxID=1927788 RepID=UPI0020077506|nr:Mss4-like protein [Annulohypoxylon maeteangense]KAI0888303.1 Mss4-like protein [Annulohypoxylon maeteangense]
MAKQGSCFCGKVRISIEGEPVAKVLCHCLDCRKITGSVFSTNLITPGSGFKVLSGEPKAISKTGDSGNEVTSHFCGDCGSTLWRDGPSFGDNKVIKVGVLDDYEALNEAKPVGELFINHRVNWVPEVPGTAQKSAM